MNAMSAPSHLVMPGLVPGIHGDLDCRVKPGNDGLEAAVALVER